VDHRVDGVRGSENDSSETSANEERSSAELGMGSSPASHGSKTRASNPYASNPYASYAQSTYAQAAYAQPNHGGAYRQATQSTQSTQSTQGASAIALPARLPAACIVQSANDYALPAILMTSIIYVESRGRSVIGHNKNGSLDIGVAQHNTRSWVPYFRDRYGIKPQTLLDSPCQSIRAQAYALRSELNNPECRGVDLWCAVGRYHSPRNHVLRQIYTEKVQKAMIKMLRTGKFD
jgi:hypothetical protein